MTSVNGTIASPSSLENGLVTSNLGRLIEWRKVADKQGFRRSFEHAPKLDYYNVDATPDGDVVSLGTLRDEFLDAYWTWRQQPDATSQAALETAADRIKAVDPKFGFELPQ